MMYLYLLYRLAFLTAFMCFITQYKYSTKKTYIIVFSFILVIWVINAAIYRLTNVDFTNTIYPLTVSVPVLICFFLLSKSTASRVFFSFLTVCNFGMLTSFVGLIAYNLSGSFAVRVLFEFASVILIILLILKVFRKPYFIILNTLQNGWWYLCAVPGLLSVIIYLLLYYPTEIINRPGNIPITFLIFALMFTFYAIVYLSFNNITQYYQLRHEKEFMLLQNDLQKKEYAAITDKVNAIRIFRHDMRHHLTVIHTFLDDGNIAEAGKYLNRLNDNLSSTIIEQYCENYMVNVILSSYIGKAKDAGINVKCEACIPEKIKIDNVELGSVFANAIENAINACKKNENPAEKKITIVCRDHCDQIYIQICNPFVGEVHFDGEYPVSDNKGHGFGTRSIAATAEKNGGIFSFMAEAGVFKTTVILNKN